MVPPPPRGPHDTATTADTAGTGASRSFVAMTSRTRRVLAAILFFAIGFGVARGADYLAEREPAAPEASPSVTGISADAKEIRTVPDVSKERRKDATGELAETLRTLYSLAFTRPPDATPEPTPTPSPARRVRELLTDEAVAALKKSPEVFDLGELVVTGGVVTFRGVVTFGPKRPGQAYLDVDFVGRATPIGRSTPIVRVHQRGTISLDHRSEGGARWRIDGFDLRFATKPEPTPTPTPPDV